MGWLQLTEWQELAPLTQKVVTPSSHAQWHKVIAIFHYIKQPLLCIKVFQCILSLDTLSSFMHPTCMYTSTAATVEHTALLYPHPPHISDDLGMLGLERLQLCQHELTNFCCMLLQMFIFNHTQGGLCYCHGNRIATILQNTHRKRCISPNSGATYNRKIPWCCNNMMEHQL